jgi:sentrin-specific protease 8
LSIYNARFGMMATFYSLVIIDYSLNLIEIKENMFDILGPEVTQAIKMMGNRDDVNEIFLNPLNPASRSHIIFAVNDNSSDKAGGSHWSLCVFSKDENVFHHFDSLTGSNKTPCSSLVKILQSCLNCGDAELINVPCLQQSNGYDCGIFVLCHADLVCQTLAKRESINSIKKLQIKKVHVKRNETLQIIDILNTSD